VINALDVVRSFPARRLCTLLLALAVLANGAVVLATADKPGHCSTKGHPCAQASIASCCCGESGDQTPATTQATRADVRPLVKVAVTAPGCAVLLETPHAPAVARATRARLSIPLVILFSSWLI
jgi:hypothetical protein